MTTEVKLPEPRYPMVTRVISNLIFPVDGAKEPITWIIGRDHPLVPVMRIVRMFSLEQGGVEIYSVSKDGNSGMRNRIPESQVLLVEEGMPISVLVEQIAIAESEDDDDDEPEEEEEPDQAPVSATTESPNGQALT